jgi:phosphoglycolate phosphatase
VIRAIAFDLDGTLIDTAPDLAASANLMLAHLGCAPLAPACVPQFIGAGISAFVARVLEQSKRHVRYDPVLNAGAEALFRRLYREHLFERSRIYPEVRATLQSLDELGTVLCCITNKESAFTAHLLRAAHLDIFFQHTICADHLEDRKPSANMLLQACALMKIEPRDLLYVGDSRADIIAARTAGCPIAAVTYGYQDAAALDQLRPDELIEHFGQIPAISERICAAVDETAEAVGRQAIGKQAYGRQADSKQASGRPEQQ